MPNTGPFWNMTRMPEIWLTFETWTSPRSRLLVRLDHVSAFNEVTDHTSITMINGDHFEITEQYDKVFKMIEKVLAGE